MTCVQVSHWPFSDDPESQGDREKSLSISEILAGLVPLDKVYPINGRHLSDSSLIVGEY